MAAGTPTWGALHDLALIYLSLTHGTDAQLDEAEKEAMLQQLAKWDPRDGEQGDAETILDEVMLVYMSGSSDQMLYTSVVSLGQKLSDANRVAILNDLADMASADGEVVPNEVSFIRQVAQEWGVSADEPETTDEAVEGGS